MQTNHPGRQVFAVTNPRAIAPSAIPVDIEGASKLFSQPREMTENDISYVISQFAATAELAERAGFDDVQIHAAQGYLISQFLSPLTNRRGDSRGRSLENRARLLIDILRAVRARVSPSFGVGVKLKSADFQKGGFDFDDATAVVTLLNAEAVDLIEISGGSYESPAMQGPPEHASTRAREGCFVDFARYIVGIATMPVMVTGGIRSRAKALDALEAEKGRPGVAMIGIGQALAYDPDPPNTWRTEEKVVAVPGVTWTKRILASLATMTMAKAQPRRMGAGKSPKAVSALWSVTHQQLLTRRRDSQYRTGLAKRSES